MLLSKLIGERFKEKPAEATVKSHELLIRGGYIKQVGSGLYSLTPLAKMAINKIENIVREEMNKIEGQECLFPVLMPRSLWDESGRYSSIGAEMFRLKDRKNGDFVLGMTHEEAAVQLVRNESDSYKRYPFCIYQIQTKLRDEPRPRAGLIRVREFTMKDAYSFHTSQRDLEDYYYNKALPAYKEIYKRCGLNNVIVVSSDSGMMGGKIAHEFMSINDAGEDKLLICKGCGKAYNQEVAKCSIKQGTLQEENLKEVLTPNQKTIEEVARFLNKKQNETCKAVVFGYEKENAVVVFIRGDRDVNEIKLSNYLHSEVYPIEDLKTFNLVEGYIGPLNLNEHENLKILFDESLMGEKNLVIGANKVGYHSTGFSISRDLANAEFVDVNLVCEGDYCECGNSFVEKRGVEVGNIFQLGTKYTQSMNMTYLDENGKKQTPIMGCYGIGVGRILACLFEENADNFGPVFNKSVCPFEVHICILGNNAEMKEVANLLYNKLKEESIEVILDDRNQSTGITFADADLIGAPFRVIFGAKNFVNNEVEIVSRDKSFKKQIKIEEALNVIKTCLQK